MSPLPRKTILAGRVGLQKKAQPWTITGDDFFDLSERLRAQMAELTHAKAGDFALVPSVSYGMAVIAKNLELPEGSKVLILDRQFPSNVYPWRDLATRTGAEIIHISPEAGHSWTEAVLAAIDGETALLALPQVHWIEGAELDLIAIGKKARANGALLVLDLTQSLGAVPFSVTAVDPDYFVVANYKWLLGPYSTGFLYAAPRHQSGQPLEQCWQSRFGSENFAELTQYTDQLAAGARRYDMGERSNFALLPAVEASLAQLLEWGVENIEHSLRNITDQLASIAAKHGLQPDMASPRAANYLSLKVPTDAPSDILQQARAAGLYFSHRGDRLRITPHLWVNQQDLHRFDQTLGNIF
ncbi:MAG: aminotransferase [Robiginitomaculum sp.]|nr:MAG: aminotransferase [Robiginitomaculum sp.]